MTQQQITTDQILGFTEGGGGGAGAAQVDIFTTSGTWTKPAGAAVVFVTAIGGGGGGGSGRRGASGTQRLGGNGGAGAARTTTLIPAEVLGTTETVTVGAAGSGGAPAATDSTNGANGGDGGDSSFGTWAKAQGGLGGRGGDTGTLVTTVGTDGLWSGGLGGFGGGASSASGVGGSSGGGGGGGGGGGNAAAGNTINNGGNGGAQLDRDSAGGTGGVGAGAAGTSATDQSASAPQPGAGGGGGAGHASLAGGAGGHGANYGGGGGGAGGGTNGSLGGAGGDGGDGLVIVVTYFEGSGSSSSAAGTMTYRGDYVSGGGVIGDVVDYAGKTYLATADNANDPATTDSTSPTVSAMSRAGVAAVNGSYVDLTTGNAQQGAVHDDHVFGSLDMIEITALVNNTAAADGLVIGLLDSTTVGLTEIGSSFGFTGLIGAWIDLLSWTNNRVESNYVTVDGGARTTATLLTGLDPNGTNTWVVTFTRITGQHYSLGLKRDGVILFSELGDVIVPAAPRVAVGAYTGGSGGLHQLRSLSAVADSVSTGWRRGVSL